MELTLEINQGVQLVQPTFELSNGNQILFTPPLDENFWFFRVKVSQKQALLGFPKFGVCGIGFAKETDWNTNLPAQESALKIWGHIKHNKGRGPKQEDCIQAIQMIQEAAQKYEIGSWDAETMARFKNV